MTPKHLSRGLLPVDILALTLHHEAAGEGRAGMVAVGQVIRHRAARRRQSVADVCLARRQFSCWAPEGGEANHRRLVEHANLIRLGQTPGAMRLAYDVARGILAGTEADETGGADHYLTSALLASAPPAWARGQTPSAVIGAHTFFRLEDA